MEMAPPQIGRALVVVVDDRVSHGEREDSTGPLVTELLEEARLVVDGVVVVPGDPVAIRNALNTAVIGGVDLVVTVGGTGVSPRDVTADATAGRPRPADPRHRRGHPRLAAWPRAPWTPDCRAGSSGCRAARSW